MSPNINSFVGDLVEMARAMEELPKVTEALEIERKMSDDKSDRIQQLELRIIDMKNSIDEKLSLIRSLEVARDDAELRFLELEEKSGQIDAILSSIRVSASHGSDLLNPPSPEPVVQAQPVDPKPEPKAYVYCDDNEPFLSTADGKPESVDTTPTVAMSGDPTNVDSWASGPGQSETDPIAKTDHILSESVSSPIVAEQENVFIQGAESKPSGRYSGKRYYDWSTYVSLNDWLFGGGTQADYDWRPGKIASC